MRNKLLLLAAFTYSFAQLGTAQCEINVSANPTEIVCGQSSTLSAYGSSTGQIILDEDFNTGGFGPGWGSTPGATSFSNPCSPGGVDGTPHAWMDNNTSVPRTLVSATYDLTAAVAGVSICFDLLFAEQGDAAPCEGPDEPDEGVYLQYSTDGGATWIDIHYFDPNGGNDPQLTNWNNWCFQIPGAAITSATMFRWHQTADSGADYDHWGIDNVQIFQNDINSEVVWLHDGYSYGVGNPGGDNPTDVSPTSTTTYTAQITTGTGDVCTADITVVVIDPVFDVNVAANPSTICDGECTDITGTAEWVIDPGGVETYENNQLEIVATGAASVNINIQDLNMTTVNPGSILEVCINDFNFSGSELCTNFFGCTCNGAPISFGDNCNVDASSFNITLTAPNGCVITLVPAGDITATGIQDMCFIPVGGAPISSGSGTYSGQFDPSDPLSGLDGCDANGVWTLEFNTGLGGFGFGFGSLTGWNITFDDPPILAPVDVSWSPATGLADPNSINTEACPLVSTDYEITVSNGTPGCATYTEIVSITVDPCSGCIPPVLNIDPLVACAPSTVDLANGINVSSDPATISYHGSQVDAQNDVNPIAQIVGASGSYWIRAEDPLDPTCFEVYEVIVTINPLDDASFTLTDFCAGSANSATGIATPGGTFAFNPAPGDGATINGATGAITNGVAGTTYTVEYTTAGACPNSSTETVTVTLQDDASFTLTDFCAGSANSATGIATPGGTFAFNPAPGDGATINAATGAITNGVTGTTYTVEYTTAGACSATTTETVTVTLQDDASFTLTDFCAGSANSATGIATPGGTFTFNPAPGDGATINGATGEITNGVTGTTYTVEYTTAGACSATTTETVTVTLQDDASFTLTDFCAGSANSATGIATPGGTFAFNPAPGDGATINGATGEITNGVTGTTYTVEYTTAGACSATTTETVTVTLQDDASFTLTDFCAGSANSATGIATPGGTFAFNPAPGDGATINAATGEITNGVTGTTYTVEYTTAGACSATTTETVTVTLQDDASFTLTDFCAGSANSATGIATPGGTFAFNPAPGDGATINAATGAITNGVTGTTYTVEYTTAGACSATTTETVTVTLQDDASFTLTDFCAGSANSATGIATPGGTFAFNPAPGDGATINAATGEITNGVTGTTYTVEYTTAGACSATTTETVTVSGLNYNASIVDENCGLADGEINITPVGGTPGFTYSIDGGITTQGSPNFTGLSAGNYDIEITDALGCVATGNESVANLGGAVIDNITPTNESCPGACDGTITVAVSGGNPPYSYQWFDDAGNPIGPNAATIDNLCDGDYSVEVSDAAGGSTQLFYDDFESGAAGWTLNVPVGAEGADPNYFEVDDDEGGVAAGGCGIAGNGDATLHITSVFFPGGGAAYDAGGLCGLLFCPETHRQAESPMINTVGQTGLTLNFDFIAGGAPPVDQATVWYNDGFGWTLLAPLFSGTGPCAPQGIWTAFSSALPASCENIANLQVAIRWDNNDDGVGTDPSVAINNLEIITSASASCTSTDFATLVAPIPDDPTFTLTDFCAGTANSATGIVTPGGTFDFNPAPGDGATIDATTGEITNGVPGTTYTVEYTTGGACPETSIETVEAQDCCNIVLDTTSTIQPSCGQADGTINVQAVGGDGNYTYSIDNGPFVVSNSFTNLTSGTYEIVVQDGTGICSDTIDVQLSDLNAPVIAAVNVIDPLCNGDLTGEVEVIANGGFGILDYEIGNPGPITNNGTGVFLGLGAGNYTITVTDANGCQATDVAVIAEPTPVTIDFNPTDVTCFGMNDGEIEVIGGGGTPGYNYSIDNGATWNANPIFSGLTAQTYQVIVEDANGCLSVVEDVIINESNALVVNTVVTDETCFSSCDGSITWNVVGGTAPYDYVYNGTTAAGNNVDDLCAGNYNYTITDANGCSSVGVETVQPGVEVQPVVVSQIDDGCEDDCDGEFVVGSNTGVSYTLNGVTNGTGVFTGLCAGSYDVLVTDVNGCTANQSVVLGTVPPTYADFIHFPTTISVYNNTINLDNNSINADQYEWEITGENGYSFSYSSEDVEHTFPTDTGAYQICLTAINSGGCQDEMCITIHVEDEIAIYVPNSFTPDDDEFNQTFRAFVNGIDLFDFDFLIFNRWGELIWESHDASVGWDGTYKGKLVQEGVYVWKIVVKDLQLDYRRTYTGHVSILK